MTNMRKEGDSLGVIEVPTDRLWGAQTQRSPPVHHDGRTFLPGQANNFYIFPAVGMAIVATRASRVTDEMFIAAARAVADRAS